MDNVATELVPDQVVEQVNKELTFFQKLIKDIQGNMISFGLKLLFACIVLVIGCIIIRLICKAVNKALEKAAAKSNFSHINFIEETIKVLLYGVLAVIIAAYFGISTASVVALLGSAGLTIGLAFQGALSNFAGGVLLLINRPFKVDDYVIIGANNVEGKIVDIGIIYTTVAIAGQKTIVIPNGSIANSTITNLTLNGVRFLEIVIGISYSADSALAKSVLTKVASNNPLVLQDRPISTYVVSLDDSCVNISLRAYTRQDDFFTARCNLLEESKTALEAAGISIPFNQLDVHVIQ